MTISNASHSGWSGMLPVEDTALAVTDTCGTGTPVVYLNGSYASQRHWRPVINDLGSGWRHITYDERARGKSKKSADYSFEACIRDLDAVLKARRVERPILVGWSYGALLGVHWAARNPGRVAGVVGVDGPYPTGWTDDADHERIRQLFRKFRWALPMARLIGNAARMSAAQHADINIEAHIIHAALEPVLDSVTVPVRYVVASGEALGSKDDEQERMRTTLNPVLARNPNLTISAKVASNHGTVVRKDFRAIAAATREVAALTRESR
ncbi:alpha/beta fold hydrolase [Nonomuraea sediminis]|uniref:alpha/beta fold hydrolase n=1 Tax=Nonomuraea sediminis TaxID=2835864 RepID=UPI001BDC8238|nr:alpha/beta fold hydrolase [Nonomuraea sediminis]